MKLKIPLWIGPKFVPGIETQILKIWDEELPKKDSRKIERGLCSVITLEFTLLQNPVKDGSSFKNKGLAQLENVSLALEAVVGSGYGTLPFFYQKTMFFAKCL